MPELPEVHRFADLINRCGKLFAPPSDYTVNAKHSQISLSVAADSVRLEAKARGKEMRLLLLSATSNQHELCRLFFTHGLVGRWQWVPAHSAESPPRCVVLRFSATDGSGDLCLVDSLNMAKWRVGESWGPDRGPDPIDEFDAFKSLVRQQINKQRGKPIAEVMLDQSLFNGIGNYLRAEVLYLASISPFSDAAEVLSDDSQFTRIVEGCRSVALDVLRLGLNKYGTPEEVQTFNNWLKIYGKGLSKKDSNKRVIWYSENQLISTAGSSVSKSVGSSVTDNKSPTTAIVEETVRRIVNQCGVSGNERYEINELVRSNEKMVQSVISTFLLDGDYEEAIDSLRRLNQVAFVKFKPTTTDTVLNEFVKNGLLSESDSKSVNLATHKHLLTSIWEAYKVDNDTQEAIDSLHRLINKKSSPSSNEYQQLMNEMYKEMTDSMYTELLNQLTTNNNVIKAILDAYKADHDKQEAIDSFTHLLQHQSTPTTPTREVTELIAHLTAADWKQALQPEFTKPYFINLAHSLSLERKGEEGDSIYPAEELVFNALNLCPLAAVKVVILGQDPYHDVGQAHGLCFSVPPGVTPVPPSLQNVFEELRREGFGVEKPARSGDLRSWARQGVLLLNTILTVRAHKPMSHAGLGWQEFTTAVLRCVARKRPGCVFMLWGNEAAKKAEFIQMLSSGCDHGVLVAAHPSPMAGNKFIGCNHFSLANSHLCKLGLSPINWSLS